MKHFLSPSLISMDLRYATVTCFANTIKGLLILYIAVNLYFVRLDSSFLCFVGPYLQQLWTALHKLCKWVPSVLFQQGHFQRRTSKLSLFTLILNCLRYASEKLFSFEYPRLNITESKSAGKRCLSLTTRPALTSLQQSLMGYSEFLMTRAGFHRCHFFLVFIITSLHHLHFNYPAFEWISSLGYRPHLPSEMPLSSWQQSTVFQAKNASPWIYYQALCWEGHLSGAFKLLALSHRVFKLFPNKVLVDEWTKLSVMLHRSINFWIRITIKFARMFLTFLFRAKTRWDQFFSYH